MGLNSITLDGHLCGRLERRRFRNVAQAWTFVLEHGRLAGYQGPERYYVVYTPLDDPAGIALAKLNPQMNAYIGVVGKIRGVEKWEGPKGKQFMTAIQLTQMNIQKDAKAAIH